jgi:hypothetical protein
MSFRRNRESRSREAAGRRNWPEAVPRKMRGRKRPALGLDEGRKGIDDDRIGAGLENETTPPCRYRKERFMVKME